VFLAGQITGVEGYVESAACGLWLGMHLAARLAGRDLPPPPAVTAMGALLNHVRTPARNFQPSNVNFGLMEPLNRRAGKKKRFELYALRAREAWRGWLDEAGGAPDDPLESSREHPQEQP
jgi:methylenetetrahydrofolate--tRNA-(uracil-5-)-methyltransferase